MNPDFNKFLDAFNEHALRPILEAGKEKLDKALDSMSSQDITRAVEDAYNMINGANGIDGLIGKIDTTKIADAVDQLKFKLQDPKVSEQVATALKQVANQTSAEQIEKIIFKAVEKAPLEQQFAAQMLIAQLGPVLDDIKAASVEDVAQQVRSLANNLSGYDVAEQVKQLIQTGVQQLDKQSGDLSGQLPKPQEVVDTIQGLGKAASETLGKAAKGTTFAETLNALKEFNDKVLELGNKKLPKSDNDNTPAVKNPAPKGPKKGKKGPKNGGWKI